MYDVRDGRWLVTRDDVEWLVIAKASGSSSARDVSWLDGSLQPVMSAALKQAFDNAEFDLTRTSTDPKERLTIACRRKT